MMNFIVSLLSLNWQNQTYNIIFVIINCYIKMMRYFSTTFNIDAFKLTELFIDMILKNYSLSMFLITNHEFLFMSSYWSLFCYQLKIKWKLNTVFYFQTDDQTECQNQILEHYLKCYCNYQQNDWIKCLFTAEFVYNNVMHFFTKITFFFALYEQNFCMSLDIKNDVFKEKTNAVDQQEMNSAANQHLKRLWKMQNQLKEHLQDITTAQMKYHNWKHKLQIYVIKNKILLIMKNLWMIRFSKKLDNQ